MTTRRPIIVGNWKMNLGGREGLEPTRQLIEETAGAGSEAAQLVILPPFTALAVVHELTDAHPSPLEYGSQDVSTDDRGAFTGEVSGAMLAEFGCRYTLVGHSERRARHGEESASINAKVHAALRHRVTPILCVGEDLGVRRDEQHVPHTTTQVAEALADVSAEQVARMLIAYEPVWAIGTGEVATPADAQEVCAAIRDQVAALYDRDTADRVRILYGGSVTPASSGAIVGQPDVDGALVGGASLDPTQLIAIWRAARLPGTA